uniref:Metallo-beta-lactamase domain-containing protein n=1 Tax=Chromera velia CCMP2878 TaxID=1169474 RepID=A0A0G4F312_9ALVE|eukprot:Cvel_14774.t1-p1 / transcript=Cvel_14774.t1 / gene=Cvel_14774 / organism=Chromera_velia_CCMP2878 / gene_product=hypothetical protein / transcript_product=hypothetical protein / location=Cvel_scaffold1064:10909-13142(+) / protein_length=336 / sequence_SO=supercontig / SO=protein_coding / is_pseudo=false
MSPLVASVLSLALTASHVQAFRLTDPSNLSRRFRSLSAPHAVSPVSSEQAAQSLTDAEDLTFPELCKLFKETLGEGDEPRAIIAKGGGAEVAPGVFHLGYHAKGTFGAAAYLVTGTPVGNVMIDCPRFSPELRDALAALGGLDFILLSHTDDMDGHNTWAEAFPGCKRIIHGIESRTGWNRNEQKPWECEVQLGDEQTDPSLKWAEGPGPWYIGGEPSLHVIHTPGHSKGHVTLRVSDRFLFTGDHLSLRRGRKLKPDDPQFLGFSLIYGEDFEEQERSVLKLAASEHPFRWILPGHGHPFQFSDDESRQKLLKEAADISNWREKDAVLTGKRRKS